MKIRQHPTGQNAHPLRWIVAPRTSQVSSEADLLWATLGAVINLSLVAAFF